MDLSIANSWWMYLLGIIVTIFTLIGSVFFILKSYKDAKRINMDTKILNRTILSSAIFTILPSISILVGVVALSGSLGVPLPWIRLTVIGALHYEGLAASSAYPELTNLTSTQFVTITTVMTLGILSGPIYCLLGFKAYDKKILSKARDNQEEQKEEVKEESKNEISAPKKSLGDVIFNAVFIAMISAFIVWESFKPFVKADKIAEEDAYLKDKPYIPLVVVIATFGAMALFDLLEKKLNWKWLSNFSLGLSMIIGMAASVVLALL